MMISKFLRATFLIVAVLAFVSCSNDDDNGPAEAPQVKFSAQVDGGSFRTDTASGILSNDGRSLTIIGTNDLGQSITLQIGNMSNNSPLVGEGTFPIDESSLTFITYNASGEVLTSVVEAGGAIIISNFNTDEKTIFGSFSGRVTSADAGDVDITAGSLFNVSYTEQ